MTTKYINFTEEFEQEVKQELELKEQGSRQKTSKNLTGRTYNKIIRLMMHGQLHDIVKPNDKNKKGVVVAFGCKSDMTKKLAKKIRTLQQLINDQPTHFSQGAYPLYKLKSDRKGVVWGFTKENLNQINFIFVDIDNQERTPMEIVDWGRLNGLTVNLIVRTDKGYQVFFIFKTALYLNNKRHDWILKSADMVANNVKKVFKNGSFDVDMGCVNYQICRFPRKDYIVYYNVDDLNSYDFYAKWSLKHKDNDAHNSILGGAAGGFTLVKGNLPGWCRALRGFNQYEEGDRNTCLYTVALGYKDSEIPLEQAIAELVPWMSGQGLKESDSKRTVESAYRGGKHATKQFFESLIEKYNLDVDHVASVDFTRMTEKERKRFFAKLKPAKPREQRKYTHSSERAEDLLKLANKNGGKLTGSKKELMAQLGMKTGNNKPLDAAIKQLETRDDVNVQKSRRNRNELVITIMMVDVKDNGAEGTKQAPMTAHKANTRQMTKQELQKAVALSVIGPVKEREGNRQKAVQTVGTVAYERLLTLFIQDPEAFMGGSERLNEVRQTG